MDSKTFEVEVTSRQSALYRVEAPDAAVAQRLAAERWQRAEPSDIPGVGWSELLGARVSEISDTTTQQQDEELVLRFVRERERLLLRLGANLITASVNDAISANQTAADLGWRRGDTEGSVDTVRAAQALERLCERKRLICFERNRKRAGERGDIRLYCTPEYLERLSASLHGETHKLGA